MKTGKKGVKKMINCRQLVILLFISNVLLTGMLPGISQATGSEEAIPTFIAAWLDGYYFLEDWIVQIEVSIWDGNDQVVKTGEIHVNDLNGSTVVFAAVMDSVTIVTWQATMEGLTGIHVFEITYNDPSGKYTPTTSFIELLVGQSITIGVSGMIIDLDTITLNVVKGQSVNLTGNLRSSNIAFPYFYIDENTAYLSVECNIDGRWRILDLIYPSEGIITGYNFDLEIVLPPWIPTGTINARCTFSGSSASDIAPVSFPFTINLLPGEKSLVLIPQQTTIERNNLTEQHVLPVEVQVPGFDTDPVVVDIDLFTPDGQLVQDLITNHVLTDYSSQLYLTFHHQITVGNYNLITTLKEANTGISLAFDSDLVNIIDDLLVDNFYWNVSEQVVNKGQHVNGHLVSREEDTFSGEKARLLVQVRETGTMLFDNDTDDNGYIAFNFIIPENLTIGLNSIEFTISPLFEDVYHRETILIREVVLLKDTTILHQESSFLIRLQEGWFNATVVDDLGLPVETGSLSLIVNDNMVHESTNPSTEYKFSVPMNMSKGVNIFSWQYTGSDIYRDSDKIFPITVYSIPRFCNLNSSASETFPGEEITLTGRIMEETGEGVTGAEVIINHRDNWGVNDLYDVVTGENGVFTFKIVIGNESLGSHAFTLEFKGWSEEFYQAIEGKPYFEVSVIPRIVLLVNDQLVAGEITTLLFQGKPDRTIELEILENGTWVKQAIIELDASGEHFYEWIIPENLKGEVFLRTSYSGDQEKIIFHLEIHVQPQLEVQVADNLILTDEEIEVLISCNEVHTIWLDSDPWQEGLSPGSHQFTLVFDEPGDHVLEVIASGLYILETSRAVTISVRDDYLVTVVMSSRAQRSNGFNVNVSVVNINQQPLEGFKLELFINNTLMGNAMTSQAGKAVITVSLNSGYYEAGLRIAPLDISTHVSKEIKLDGFIIYSVPVIEITDLQPVNGRNINVEVKTTDGINPLINETISVYLRSVSEDTSTLIGNNLTNELGMAVINWNVTQASGDYLLQVENSGNDLVETVIITKAVTVMENGPHIVQGSVIAQDKDYNLFFVTAVVEFPGGKGTVYLCSGDNRNQIAMLQESGNFWTVQVQLPKGQHVLWLLAVDVRGVESWKALGTINVLENPPTTSETSVSTGNNDLEKAIMDTAITAIFMLPIAAYITYKKRKGFFKN
jgi:hypothetical protein